MKELLPAITVRSTGSAYNISAQAVWVGSDLLVYIWGGEAPHIGAVAMAMPRPSLADPQRTSATASVFTYVGHKEDALAKQAAEALASSLGAKVVATAGIHWDDLDQRAIDTIVSNGKELVQLLIQEFTP